MKCSYNGNACSIRCKWFEPRNISSSYCVIIRVSAVLKRTVVGDWRFTGVYSILSTPAAFGLFKLIQRWQLYLYWSEGAETGCLCQWDTCDSHHYFWRINIAGKFRTIRSKMIIKLVQQRSWICYWYSIYSKECYWFFLRFSQSSLLIVCQVFLESSIYSLY